MKTKKKQNLAKIKSDEDISEEICGTNQIDDTWQEISLIIKTDQNYFNGTKTI